MEKITEIEHHELRLLKAIKENNLDELDDLLHPELVFLNPMGQILTKEMDLDNYRSGQIMIEALEPSAQRIRIIKDTAIVTVKIKLKGRYMEHTLDENFHYIRVWTNENDIWRVIAGSAARI